MRLRTLIAVSSLPLSLVLGAAPARADSAAPLGLETFSHMVVDAAHGHVFVSTGSSEGLRVFDLNGNQTGSVSNMSTAAGLALSPDGSTLYVALNGLSAISAVSTATLTETARYALPSGSCPTEVAAEGTHVWTVLSCNPSSNTSDLGLIDLSSSPPTIYTGFARNIEPPVQIAASGQRPGVLAYTGAYSGYLYTLNVSGPAGSSPVQLASRSIENYGEIGFSSDGSKLLQSAYPVTNYAAQAFDPTTLAPLSAYQGSQASGSTLAVTSAGYVITGGTDGSEITVDAPDGSVVRTFPLPNSSGQISSCCVQSHGLAVTPDGTRLFAVTGDYLKNELVMRVFADPTKYVSTLTLTPPAKATIGAGYSSHGVLTAESRPVAGVTVHVERVVGSAVNPLPDETTQADGSFSIPDVQPTRGSYTYVAYWGGDSTRHSVSASVTVPVKGNEPTVTVSSNQTVYGYKGAATITVHLSGTATRTVSVYVQPYGKSQSLLKTMSVDANGNASLRYTVTARTDFTASYAGDPTTEPRLGKRRVTVHVGLTQKPQAYYGRSGSDYLYHVNQDPTIQVDVAPNNAGVCMSWEAQRYASGAWSRVASNSCITLNQVSATDVVFVGKHLAGRYRIDTTFSGSDSNAATTGPWMYMTFS